MTEQVSLTEAEASGVSGGEEAEVQQREFKKQKNQKTVVNNRKGGMADSCGGG